MSYARGLGPLAPGRHGSDQPGLVTSEPLGLVISQNGVVQFCSGAISQEILPPRAGPGKLTAEHCARNSYHFGVSEERLPFSREPRAPCQSLRNKGCTVNAARLTRKYGNRIKKRYRFHA